MGKLIAVWGSPGSGKTTFSVKLAEALYNRSRGKSAVIVVFTDIVTPTIPVIFPNFRSEDVFSVGTILSKPDFFADDVVSNMVMTKDRMNLGYLGYKDSENHHSFPEYTDKKAKYLYDVLVGIADYVIVDCMSLPDSNFLTSVALENADQIIRLSTPDLKCLSFQMSQLKTFASRGYLRENDVAVMNIPREEFNLAAADARLHLGKIAFIVPYCSTLIEQYMEGSLYEPMKDKKFMQTIKAIAERVV